MTAEDINQKKQKKMGLHVHGYWEIDNAGPDRGESSMRCGICGKPKCWTIREKALPDRMGFLEKFNFPVDDNDWINVLLPWCIEQTWWEDFIWSLWKRNIGPFCELYRTHTIALPIGFVNPETFCKALIQF